MSNIIVVHKKVESQFNTIDDLLKLYCDNGGMNVLGVYCGDRLATIQGKKLVKGVRGFIVTYGCKGGKAKILESTSKAPSNFTEKHLTNYNYQVFTQGEFDQYIFGENKSC